MLLTGDAPFPYR